MKVGLTYTKYSKLKSSITETVKELNKLGTLEAVGVDWRTITPDLTATTYDGESEKVASIKDIDLLHVFSAGTLYDKWNFFTEQIDLMNKHTTVINNPETIKYFSSKEYMFDFALPFVPTIGVDAKETTLKEIQEYASEYGIIKPINGERATLVHKIEDVTKEILAQYQTTTDTILLQPFMEEIYEGERSIVFIGDTPLHQIRKTPQNSIYANGEYIGAKVEREDISKEAVKLASDIRSQSIHSIDIFRLDFLQTKQGIRIMEIEAVNPAYYMDNCENFSEGAKLLSEYYLKK